MNPVQLEIYKNRLRAIAEEMGVVLCRSAYSSNIKERRDFSCAIFDAQGQMVAQAEHLPVHLGSMPLAVAAALERRTWQEGDSVIVNDPFAGGTHLPDITMIDPVFMPGLECPAFFVANRAHHSDVGGMTPGSMPLSTDIFQEGLRLPPLHWVKAGQRQEDLLQLILANVRTPIEREGDLMAQWAANRAGIQQLTVLCKQAGLTEVNQYCAGLLNYTETMMQTILRDIPDGVYCFEDRLDNDGIHPEPVRLQVSIQITGEKAIVDFTGSSPQTSGGINTIYAVTLSCVFYAFRCLLEPDAPSNAGCLRPITVIAPAETVVNARFPSAVVGGNVETSQRLVDVLFGALAQAMPERIPAASCGSMNNLTIGGFHLFTGQPFTYYETIGGGMGARPDGPGLNGIHTHMTNTLNTPIEALELAYPLRVHQYQLLPHTGGIGLFCGGNGMVREIELLTPAQVTLLTDRRAYPPYGLAGGSPGSCGHNSWCHQGQWQALPSKCSRQMQSGDKIKIQTPGGGGWGIDSSDTPKSPERDGNSQRIF